MRDIIISKDSIIKIILEESSYTNHDVLFDNMYGFVVVFLWESM